MNDHSKHCNHTHASKRSGRFLSPLSLTLLSLCALIVSTYFFPALHTLRHALLGYLLLMAVPVALGLTLGGLIDYFIPREYISKLLAQRNKRTILLATGLGFLMSACSHGIMALTIELHKKGASGPAVVSFLLASPWANLPVTFLLIGFFGLKGFLIVASAFLIAFLTGLGFQILDEKGWIERNQNIVPVDAGFSIRRDIAQRLKNYRFASADIGQAALGISRGIVELADMILWWILIGIILASLAQTFIPVAYFQRFLAPTFLGLVTTLGLATIFEVCSEGTSPLAFEIYKQTGALGNAFAFLMGGVVTDYTEVGLIWANVGKKTAIWMLILTLPQVLLIGWVFNRLL